MKRVIVEKTIKCAIVNLKLSYSLVLSKNATLAKVLYDLNLDKN